MVPKVRLVEYGLALILLAALVAVVVVRPLGRRGEEERLESSRIQELQAAKEAKYREIRDAELDREMGKLSQDDWRSVDRDLRGEAIEILRQLDRLEGARSQARSSAARSRSPRTISANATVQRFRLRSTSDPPPNGPAPVPTPKAPESPVSLPECSRIRTIRTTQRMI